MTALKTKTRREKVTKPPCRSAQGSKPSIKWSLSKECDVADFSGVAEVASGEN